MGKYLSFASRAQRTEWWLVQVIVVPIVLIVQIAVVGSLAVAGADALASMFLLLSMAVIVWLALAVNARRWHDRNKSGWWSLIGLAPIAGIIWIIVECGFLGPAEGAHRFEENVSE